MLHKFSFMNQPIKILTKQGGGRLGCSWSVTKSMTRHKAIKSFRKSDTRNFLLEQIHWLPLKWLILHRNAMYVWDSLPYPTEIFYPYSQSLYRWSFGHTPMTWSNFLASIGFHFLSLTMMAIGLHCARMLHYKLSEYIEAWNRKIRTKILVVVAL